MNLLVTSSWVKRNLKPHDTKWLQIHHSWRSNTNNIHKFLFFLNTLKQIHMARWFKNPPKLLLWVVTCLCPENCKCFRRGKYNVPLKNTCDDMECNLNLMHQGYRFQVDHHFLHTLFRSTLEIHRSCEDPPEANNMPTTFPVWSWSSCRVKENTKGRTKRTHLYTLIYFVLQTQYPTVCITTRLCDQLISEFCSSPGAQSL